MEVHPAGQSELLRGKKGFFILVSAAVWPRNKGSEESSCSSYLLDHSAKPPGTRHEHSSHGARCTGSVLVNTATREEKTELLAAARDVCLTQTHRPAETLEPPDGRAAPRGGVSFGSRSPKSHPHGASPPVASVVCTATAGWRACSRGKV